MASNIFERLRTSFMNGGPDHTHSTKGEEKPDALSRYFGGNERKNQPFISGYWQLWISPPGNIFGETKSDVSQWLHSSAEGFTPPTRTLNKADLPGQGGVGSSFVTGQTLTRSFTVTFREFMNLPILNIFELWTSIIDSYTGVSPVNGSNWLPSIYKGSAFVIATKPTQSLEGKYLEASDIEQAFYFHGVFPESAPYDSLGQDIATNDFAQHSISFSFDGWPLTKAEPDVVKQALTLLNEKSYFDGTYTPYQKSVTSTTVD